MAQPNMEVEDVNDDESRQFTYGFFHSIFRGEASILAEKLDIDYTDIVGGNVIGFKRMETASGLNKGRYQVDVVFFKGEAGHQAFRYTYELVTGKNPEGEVTIDNLNVMNEEELKFSAGKVVDSIKSDTGRFEATVEKRVIPVNFYTIEGVNIPAFLGRYDLVVHDLKLDEEFLVDFSFDPFSTNLPFEMRGFMKNEEYFDYFEQNLGRLYNVFDIERGVRTDIQFRDFFGEGFWYNGYYIVCSVPDHWAPTISVFKPPNWGLLDQYYIYPMELNSLETEQKIRRSVPKEPINLGDLNCDVDNEKLYYSEPSNSTTLEFDLSTLESLL